MIKSLVKVVALLSAALLLLTGCSQNSPSVAATVGSTTITVAQVDAASKAVASAYAASSGLPPRAWGEYRTSVLYYLIHKELLRIAVQESRVQLTEEQLASMVNADPFIKALFSDAASRDVGLALVLTTVAKSSSEVQNVLPQVFAGVPVDVNPVFGTWDASQAVFTSTSGSLSVDLAQIQG